MTSKPAAPARGERERERLRHVEALRFDGAAAVPALLAVLVEPSWSVRRAVVAVLAAGDRETALLLCEALEHVRDDEAKIAGIVDALSASKADVDDSLIALTRSANPAVVCDAVQILGRHESTRALPALQTLTEHPDDNVALATVEALGRIGGKAAVDALLKLAQSGNFFRSFPAIDALGRARDPRALETLVGLASEALYAPEAVRALGRLGDPAAAPHLVRLAASAGESLLRNIALALVAIRDQSKRQFGTGAAVERAFVNSPRLPSLRQQLSDSVKRADPSEQLALGQLLAWIGDESTVPTLLALLEGPGAVAQMAAASLKQLAAVAEPQLVEALRDAAPARRRLLIPVVGGRASARDALVECLGDDDAVVRALACDALARSSDAAVVPAIFELLGDGDARVAQAALGAVQSLGSNETRELTLKAAASSDERIRCAALRIIGYFAYPEGFARVAAGATDASERVRDAAIGGLPLFDTTQAAEVLIGAAHHASMRTRTSAIRALGQTSGGASVLAELRAAVGDESPWVRYYACQSLGKLRDEDSTALLAERLADGSGQVQVAAVDALAHLRGPRAFEVLSATVGSADPDLHRAALVALGISKRPEALPQLLAALTGDDAATRLVALSALAELGLPEVVPALARAIDDRDEGVRVAATGFLAARSDEAATTVLIALVVKTPDREALVQALGHAVPGRVEAIRDALLTADDSVASALVGSLAHTGSREAIDAIRNGLQAKNDATRRASASALLALQDAESATALAHAALKDPDAEVRRISAAALHA
ncbi:MAG TPA: HEAT repeat domain-containing protein [Polyangiaceae bacterium]|nr:HEAT repeat domain-containing protein [Polyangiaceae bacterium]